MLKEIKGFNNYLINEDGLVKRKDGFTPKTSINCHGYIQISLRGNDGKWKTLRLHRLLGEAFVDNPNNYETIDHIDGNKLNNSLSNLRWMPHEINAKIGNGIPVGQYTLKGELIATYDDAVEASKATLIDRGNICRACNGIYHTAGGYKWAKLGGE